MSSTTHELDFGQFRAAVNDAFVPLEVRSDRPDTFAGRIVQAPTGAASAHETGDVSVSLIAATEHTVERTPALIRSRPRNAIKVSLLLSGQTMLVQDGREVVMRAGSMALYDTNRPYSLACTGPFRSLVVLVDAARLDVPLTSVAQLTATELARGADSAAAPIVAAYLDAFATSLPTLSATSGRRMAHSAADLIATLLAEQLLRTPTRRDRLFLDVRRFIEDNLADPDLGPRAIARAHYISTRSLSALFQDHGSTVTGWIRRRRLVACHDRLGDPRYAERGVGAIARAAGFADAATFSRVYRAEFGCTPSETRRTAQFADNQGRSS